MIIGNHMWGKCDYCCKLVKLTGFWRGLHLCLTDEELAWRRECDRLATLTQANIRASLAAYGSPDADPNGA